jgi:predicted Zn-dependent protease
MKRRIIMLGILGMALAFMAFDCSSAELTGAKLYLNQKQYDKAKEALEKEVAKNPLSDEGWYLLGSLYGEQGSFDKMLDAYDKSVKASPKFAKEIADSKKYFWATSFNKGVSYFNQAAKATAPDTVKLFFGKAVENFKVSISCEPDSIVGYSNLAMVYFNLQDYDSAVYPLEKIIQLGKSPEAYTMLGQIYSEKAQKAKEAKDEATSTANLEKAIKILEEGKAKFPENADVLLRYSNALIQANKLDVAMEAFKVGVAKEPGNKYYRYNYGVVLLNSQKFAEAEEQFAEAVKLDPSYSNAIYNLAVTYVKWGDSFRQAADKKGESADVEKIKEKITKAKDVLEGVLKTDPKNPSLWDLLARVYANLGMNKESDDAFKKADQYK